MPSFPAGSLLLRLCGAGAGVCVCVCACVRCVCVGGGGDGDGGLRERRAGEGGWVTYCQTPKCFEKKKKKQKQKQNRGRKNKWGGGGEEVYAPPEILVVSLFFILLTVSQLLQTPVQWEGSGFQPWKLNNYGLQNQYYQSSSDLSAPDKTKTCVSLCPRNNNLSTMQVPSC